MPAGTSPWGIVVFFSGIVLIPLAMVIARCLTWEGSNHTSWLIWLVSVGGGMALLGHLLAWCVCVGQSGMDLTDIVFAPLRIWSMIFRSLPRGVTALCLFGFGLMTAASGGLCFGIDYETIVRTRPVNTRDQLLELVESIQGIVPNLAALTGGTALPGAEDVDASLLFDDASGTAANAGNALGETSPVSLTDGDAPALSDETSAIAEPQSVSCLVIGYIEDDAGELASLVIAVPGQQSLRYAGTVAVGAIEPEAFSELVTRSLPLRLPQAIVDCPITANWLQPDAVCHVEFEGWTEDRQLMSPRILSVLQHLSVDE